MGLDPKHETAIRTYADELGVDPDLAVSVANQESGSLGEKAVSPKGARGVMQLMPDTSKSLEPKYGRDRRRQGVGYLHDLNQSYADLPDDERRNFTLAGYNAGPGNVKKARESAKAGGLDDTKFADVSQFLPEETRNYVPGVMGRMGRGVTVAPGKNVSDVQEVHDDSDLRAEASQTLDDSDLRAEASDTPPEPRSTFESAKEFVPGLQGLTDLAKLAGHVSGVRPLSEDEWAEMAKRGEEQRAHPIATGIKAAGDIAGVAVPGFRTAQALSSVAGMGTEDLTGSPAAGRAASFLVPTAGEIAPALAKGASKVAGAFKGPSTTEMVKEGLGAATTPTEAGRLLQAPKGGAKAAITETANKASELYNTAADTAKAAGAEVQPKTVLSAVRQAVRDVRTSGGSLSGDASRVLTNIKRIGRGQPATAATTTINGAGQAVTTGGTAARSAMGVDELIDQQSRLRAAINGMAKDDPARRPLIKLSMAIDDAMSDASKGTAVGEQLADARGFYRDVTIPTRKTMSRVAAAEEPESATRLLTQAKKPTRFQRLEGQQLGENGSKFTEVTEATRSAALNDIVQSSTKGGNVDFAALDNALKKAEASGQLEHLADTAARRNTIKAIERVAKAQRLAKNAPIAVGTAGAVGQLPGFLGGYMIGRTIKTAMTSEPASRALLRLSQARQGTPGWKLALKAFNKVAGGAAKAAAPVAAIGAQKVEE